MTEVPRNPENKKFNKNRKVVVTGLGMVSPLGLDVKTSWEKLIAGGTGIVPVEMPFVKDVKVAGLVSNFNPRIALEGFVTPKDLRRISTPAQYATAAAIEACRDAGFFEGKGNKLRDGIDPNEVGVRIGSGIGGGTHISEVSEKIKAGVNGDTFDVLLILPERVSSVPGMKLGFKGPLGMPSAACATGNLAITDGYKDILLGDADISVVGGAESTVDHVTLNVFDRIKALSHETDPKEACRPFDKKRNGFVMGEGAAVIVLEEKRHAEKRNAKIYAELAGYGNTSDAYSDTAPDPNGEGAARAMEKAIAKMHGLPKKGLIYIQAHGTGTEMNDKIEISVIKRVMIENHKRKNIAVSSSKGATGHSLAGAGAMGAVFGIQALEYGILPPTINLTEPMDEAAGIDLVPNIGKKAKPVAVFIDSFGFGGFNTVTVFKKYKRGMLGDVKYFLKKTFPFAAKKH